MSVKELLISNGQEHLSEYYAQLDEKQKNQLKSQLEAFDWNLLKLLKDTDVNAEKGKISPIPVMKTEEIRAKQDALKEMLDPYLK